MIIEVSVIPNASKNAIIEFGTNEKYTLSVKLCAAPENGKANKSLIKLLSSVLKIKKTDITIVRGEKSRMKIVNINCDDNCDDKILMNMQLLLQLNKRNKR